MEEWKECKLSDICDYGKDRIEVSSLDNSNYISTENMLPNHAGITIATTLPTGEYTPSFEIDDTLVSNIRPYFKKIWKATFSGGCSADVLVFKAKENVSKEYLYYVLADDEFFKYSMTTSKGTKMPRGDKTSIMNYPINLPPLPTQQKIARILSSLDDKIELNNKINTNLEQQAGALFKNWFVDFEPFGGKMPEGWKVGKLSEIIDIRDGTHDSPKFHDSGYPLVTSKHLDSFKIDFSDMKYITEEDFEKINERSKVDTGDILYSMIGTVGNISLVIDNPVQFAIKNVGLFKTSQTPLYKYFVLNYLKTQDIKNYIDQHLAGSTQKYISLSELRGIPLFVPDTNTLEKFNSLVDPITSGIINNINENKRLSTLRDTLLPKLMSGEIDVDGVKI